MERNVLSEIVDTAISNPTENTSTVPQTEEFDTTSPSTDANLGTEWLDEDAEFDPTYLPTDASLGIKRSEQAAEFDIYEDCPTIKAPTPKRQKSETTTPSENDDENENDENAAFAEQRDDFRACCTCGFRHFLYDPRTGKQHETCIRCSKEYCDGCFTLTGFPVDLWGCPFEKHPGPKQTLAMHRNLGLGWDGLRGYIEGELKHRLNELLDRDEGTQPTQPKEKHPREPLPWVEERKPGEKEDREKAGNLKFGGWLEALPKPEESSAE